MNKNTRRIMNADKERRAMPSKRKSSWQGHPEARRHESQRPGEAIPRTKVNFKDVLKYLP